MQTHANNNTEELKAEVIINPNDQPAFLGPLPPELGQIISPFLTDKDIAHLGASSSGFFSMTKDLSYWEDKFLTLGLDQALLQQLINMNVVTDYANLYRSLIRFSKNDKNLETYFSMPPNEINEIQLWELLCLSGDQKAVEYAIQNNLINKDTKNTLKQSAIHLTALSGSAVAIEIAKLIPGLDLLAQDQHGRNALHLACLRGSAKAIMVTSNIPQLNAKTTDYNGQNVLHLSAYSGSIPALNTARAIPGLDQEDLFAVDKKKRSIIHFAGLSACVSMIESVTNIPGLNLTYTDIEGCNILHHTSISGSASSMRAAKKIIPKQLYTATTHLGENILHLAAESGNVSAIEEARIVKGLTYTRKNCRRNVLHYAAMSGSVEAIRLVIKGSPGLDHIIDDGKPFCETPFHKAANSASAAAIEEIAKIPGIDINKENACGMTALHCVIGTGKIPAIKATLNLPGLNYRKRRGAIYYNDDFATRSVDYGGETMLHYAVKSKKPETIIFIRQFIAKHNLGIDADTQDSNHKTPRMLAQEYQSPLILEALTKPLEELEQKEEGIQQNSTLRAHNTAKATNREAVKWKFQT